jgi:hypothetical protein
MFYSSEPVLLRKTKEENGEDTFGYFPPATNPASLEGGQVHKRVMILKSAEGSGARKRYALHFALNPRPQQTKRHILNSPHLLPLTNAFARFHVISYHLLRTSAAAMVAECGISAQFRVTWCPELSGPSCSCSCSCLRGCLWLCCTRRCLLSMQS